LPRAKIRLAITAAGFSEKAVQLEAPETVVIRRASQAVDPALIREAVERVALVELNSQGATARLARLDLPAVIAAPTGKLEARASIGSVRDLFSPFTASVEILADGHVAQRLSLTVQVEAFAPMLAAKRDLAPNTRIRKDDVASEARRLERALSHYLRDETQLRGISARRAIAKGEALLRDAVMSEIIVKPGDPVRIEGHSGTLHVTVMGEARAAGRVGDRIQVKNLQSGALLQAIVVDEGVVRVQF
jgi:flagella basal body P-ring formation protein FlgA